MARAANIQKFTQFRFNPEGQLALDAPPLSELDLPELITPNFDPPDFRGKRYGLLMTEEDISIDALALSEPPTKIMALGSITARSVLPLSSIVKSFAPALIIDGATRIEAYYDTQCQVSDESDWHKALLDWVNEHSLEAIVTPRIMIGPVRTRLQRAVTGLNVPLVEVARPYDRVVSQYAKRGFFGLKKKIPKISNELQIQIS